MVFERNAARPLKPASTQKILTSAAALALLRPEFLHETRLWADGAIDSGCTLTGATSISRARRPRPGRRDVVDDGAPARRPGTSAGSRGT